MGEMSDYRDYHARQDYERDKAALERFNSVWQFLEQARLTMPPSADVCPQRVHESLATTQDMVLARIAVLRKAIASYEED